MTFISFLPIRSVHVFRLTITLVALISVVCVCYANPETEKQSTQSPESAKLLLENTAHEMISIINVDRDKIIADAKVARKLIEQTLLPHIDMESASEWALGHYWKKASHDQRIKFALQFRQLMLHYGSAALGQLADHLKENSNKLKKDVIKFEEAKVTSDQTVSIKSKVTLDNADQIDVSYELRYRAKAWKVYDVGIGGVSLVENYRSEFINKIRAFGIEELIASLVELNKKNGPSS